MVDTRVQISSHRCPNGAGIECLAYQSPAGGRAMPDDLGPQDRAHGQLRLLLGDDITVLETIAERLESYGGRPISPGVVNLTPEAAQLLGFRAGLQVADPDGHRLQLVVR